MSDAINWAEYGSEKTLVEYKCENGIATITMTDPPANTYTHGMMKQLDAAIVRARFDESAHVIVITGQGSKFFSAGANIGMLGAVTPKFKYYFCLHANETLNRLEHTPKLVIAAISGHCVGGGLEIAMAADMRIARQDPEKPGKIGLPEVALGVLPGTGGTQRISRLIGKALAIELCVSGRTFGFPEAKEMGLINNVIEADHDTFMAQVYEYAASYVPPAKASFAVGMIKRSIQSGVEIPFESSLVVERELQAQLFSSNDAKEGLAAYNEKRKSSFDGS